MFPYLLNTTSLGLALSSRVSCINSLTSPTVLYKVLSTCKQKPTCQKKKTKKKTTTTT